MIEKSQISTIIKSLKIIGYSFYQDIKFILFSLLFLEVIYGIYDTEKIRGIGKIFYLSIFSYIADIIDKLKDNLSTNYFLLTAFVLIFLVIFIRLIQYFINYFHKFKHLKNIIIIIFYLLILYILIYGFLLALSNNDVINSLIPITVILLYIIIVKGFLHFLFENKLNEDGFLVSDSPIYSNHRNIDKLGFKNRVKDFSEIIYNNGDIRGFVFGLIAPWGAGKTSFLNLVKNENIINDNCLVFEFNPWYFESENILLEKFILEFKSFIINKSNVYLNELGNDLDILVKILGKKTSSLLGIELNLGAGKTLFDTKNDINISLQKINKKIIIIIDDLDRISSDKLKVVFKIINLCKDFYNTSFILCYDLSNLNNIDESLKISKQSDGSGLYSNISNEEFDNSNLIKYIEKIVSVQFSIYPDFNKLKEYFRDIFISSDLDFSDKSKEGIRVGIDSLYNIECFRIWGKHISDIRSIKRIYNNIVATNQLVIGEDNYIKNVFDIEEGLFFDSFIKLKILSLSYNNIYLDIYNEVNLGGKGNYVLPDNFKNNKYQLISKIGNSDILYYSNSRLIEYINNLPLNEREILKNIFPIIKEEKPQKISNNKDIRFGDNLQYYFDLIEINKNAGFNRYIKNKVLEFLNNLIDINQIIIDIEKKYLEKGIVNFLITFEKNISDFPEEEKVDRINKILVYILENFHKYSINSLASCWDNIAKILDKAVNHNNTNENCINTIGKFLYSSDKSIGIIDKFFNENWGIKGIYNILYIRMLAIRDSGLWNIQRGIVGEKYGLNLSKYVYYEKISKYIYFLFKKEYIDKPINIFKQLDDLDDKDFKIDEGVNSLGSISKEGIIGFILYQLSNINDGIGYFDIEGGDIENQKHGINKVLNDYFFDICLNGERGIEYLIGHISLYVNQEFHHFEKGKVNTSFKMEDIYKIYEKDRFDKFINEKNKDIEKYIKINKEKICKTTKYHINDEELSINLNFGEFWEIFNKEFKN